MTGAELRALRKRLALTQAQFAARLDLSRDRITRYELGTSPIPRVVALACQTLAPPK